MQAERLREWLAGEGVFERMTDITTAANAIVTVHDARRSALHENVRQAFHDRLEKLRAHPSFVELSRQNPDAAERIGAPLVRGAGEADIDGNQLRATLGELRARLAVADALLRDALTQVEVALAPPEAPPERVAVRRFIPSAINDEAELERRLEMLREACLSALRRGRRVILE